MCWVKDWKPYYPINDITISFFTILPIIFILSVLKFDLAYGIIITLFSFLIMLNLFIITKFISDDKFNLIFFYINLVISLTAEFIIFYNKNKFQEASLEISYFIFINFSSVWVICFIKVKFYKYCFPKAKVMVLKQGTVVEQEINSYCNQITICDVTVVDE